jgi:membrane protease YdiL (CAAX protease family)
MKKTLLSMRFMVFIPSFLFIPTVPVAVASNNILDPNFQNEYLLNGTLIIVVIITSILLLKKKWKFSDIGFKPDKPFKGLGLTLFLCLIGLLFAGPYARLLGFTETVDMSKVDIWKVVKWSFLYALAQDFMYQSFLSKVGREIFTGKNGKIITAVLVIILFTWMHRIFPRPFAVMAFVAPGSIIFTLLYNKYENTCLVSLAHTFYSLLAFYHIVFKY